MTEELKPHVVVEEWEGDWFTVYVFSSDAERKCFWAGASADAAHSDNGDSCSAGWWDITGGYCEAEGREGVVRAVLRDAEPEPGRPWSREIRER